MNHRAQSSNIGLVLLLALTITSAGVVVAIGSSALADVQQEATADRAAHAMTLLDARTAVVGLGEGSVQTVQLGRSGGGQYSSESESGWLRIRHRNYTDNETETVYNASLGSVTYQTAETEIAYQGGGVWRYRDGGTTMVSPPEFHYRDQTLTLPVIRVRSSDTVTGNARATVRRSASTTRIFPNETAATDDGVGAPYDEDVDGATQQYHNPVRSGTVAVTVHSRFYEGWAEYFRTRTTGNVSTDDGNRTATVVLETAGAVGVFPYPEKDGSVAIRGIADGHAVTNFQTSIKKDHGTFNNLYASFYIEDGDKAYEVAIEVPNGIGNNYCNGGASTEQLVMDVYYDDASTSEDVHRWSNDSIPSDSGPVQLACEGGDTVIDVDFTSSAQNFTYGSSNVGHDTAIDWDARDDGGSVDPVSFNHTGDDGENTTYYDGDEQTLRILTRHYFATFDGEFKLRVDHGPGNRGTTQIDQSASGGVLRYDTTDASSYITYLHVTQNNVTIDLN